MGTPVLPRFPVAGVRTYVEAFGGGAAALLARSQLPSVVEVYNDINSELTNAFRQVREHAPGETEGRELIGNKNN